MYTVDSVNGSVCICVCMGVSPASSVCATCVQWMVVPVDLLHNAISLHISLPSTCSHKHAYITHTHSGKSISHVCWLCQSTKPGVQEISEERVPILTDGSR